MIEKLVVKSVKMEMMMKEIQNFVQLLQRLEEVKVNCAKSSEVPSQGQLGEFLRGPLDSLRDQRMNFRAEFQQLVCGEKSCVT